MNKYLLWKKFNFNRCQCVTKDGIPIADFSASLDHANEMNCGKQTKKFLYLYKEKDIFFW
jgi:hypothetical protein